ncbi:MAG: DegV family protein [Oscillospiraceae bacterium]|nr:DegV family protein [Oscillospiraceae bacterium]
MKKIAVVTDSNSGITQAVGKEMGVAVLPMPFYINEALYFEEITLSQEEFYRHLEADADISTSQPAPGDVTDLWDRLLADHDEIVYIPMSSGLSSSCQSARMLAEGYEGRVQVVNNQRISITQRRAVLDALLLAKEGKDAAQIREILERRRFESSIYITLETLKYLKKGGRITPAAAAIGTVLNLKPVLQIQGEKLDAYAKVRGKKAARHAMLEAIRKDIRDRFPRQWAAGTLEIDLAYSGNPEEAQDWRAEVAAAFPGKEMFVDPLSLSVSCHIGCGALAVACTVAVQPGEEA